MTLIAAAIFFLALASRPREEVYEAAAIIGVAFLLPALLFTIEARSLMDLSVLIAGYCGGIATCWVRSIGR